MICSKCKHSLLGSCKKFGNYKTDSQIKAENYNCFEERIHKVRSSSKYISCEENIYGDVMTDSDINIAKMMCNNIKNKRKETNI